MPKKIVTKSTLPKILRVLDQWEGKLTWDAYCDRVAQVLGIDSVSRHALLNYPAIKEHYRRRQQELREVRDQRPRDFTMEGANRRIADLEAQVSRLEATNTLLLDQFRRWQYNAYANNVRMDSLNLDKPLPAVDRSGHGAKGKGR